MFVFGTHLISVGIQRYSFPPHNIIERAIAIVGGLLLIKPGLTSDLFGLLAAAMIAALVRMRSAKLRSAPRA